jgi:hypothetical protein
MARNASYQAGGPVMFTGGFTSSGKLKRGPQGRGSTGRDGTSACMPDGSADSLGLLLRYAYVLIPPAIPIGSRCTNRPLNGS